MKLYRELFIIVCAFQEIYTLQAQQAVRDQNGIGYEIYLSGHRGVGEYIDETDRFHPFTASVGGIEGVALYTHRRTIYSIGLGPIFCQHDPLLLGELRVAWTLLPSNRMCLEMAAGILSGEGKLPPYDRFHGGFNMSVAAGPKIVKGDISMRIVAVGTLQFLTVYYASQHQYPQIELSRRIPVSLVGIGLHVERRIHRSD